MATKELNLAGAVIYDDEGRILLLHRNIPGLTQWELPGGKVEKGETPEVTAVREIKEELGVDVNIVAYLGEASFSQQDMKCWYKWYRAELVNTADIPAICEPQTFNGLQFWDTASLEGRPDLSANLQNLLSSDTLV